MNIPSFRHFAVFFDRYYWQTAVMIARNGLARQYRNSFLGMVWTFILPLTMVGIYAIVMPQIMRFPMLNYPAYIMISMPVWSFFSVSLTGATASLIANEATLKRCMISSTLFPVADVLRSTYTFVLTFIIMQAGTCLFITPFNFIVLLTPLYFLPVLVTIGAASIAVAFVAPYLRDLGDLIVLGMNLLMWFTPIIYPLTALPSWGQEWMRWNPFFIMLRPIQMLAYEHVLPGVSDTARLFALAALTVLLAWRIFVTCRRNYVYYL